MRRMTSGGSPAAARSRPFQYVPRLKPICRRSYLLLRRAARSTRNQITELHDSANQKSQRCTGGSLNIKFGLNRHRGEPCEDGVALRTYPAPRIVRIMEASSDPSTL